MNKTGHALPVDNACREPAEIYASVVPESKRLDF